MYTTGALKPDTRSIETSWDYQDDCPEYTGAWEDPYCPPVDVVPMPTSDSRRAA